MLHARNHVIRRCAEGEADQLSALAVVDARLERHRRQLDRLAAATHLDAVRRRAAHAHRDVQIAAHEQSEAVDADDRVALLQTALEHRAALADARNGRGDKAVLARRLHREQQDDKADEKIHQRTCCDDEDAAAKACPAEGVLALAFAVLALHDARAAERQQLQAVHRAVIFVLENGRAHADPEFIDLHAAALGGDKMAEFMHDDQHAEGQNGQND